MQIIFHHVPKTAGATFRNVLKRQYKRRESFFIHDFYPKRSIGYLNNLSDSEFGQYKMIAGHCTHFLKKRQLSKNEIIFLREPVKQILSGFYHAKRSTFNKSHKAYLKIKSLKEYLDILEDSNGFNTQVNYLSLAPELYYNNKQNCLSDNDQLTKSKELIDSCDFVLLTEEFDESLLILKNALFWKEPYYLSKNVTISRMHEESQEEIKTRLCQGQKNDFQLYEYAQEKYSILKKNAFSKKMKAEIDSFKLRNKKYNRIFGPIDYLSTLSLYYAERLHFFKPSWKKSPVYSKK